jgi:hypothetical protein
MDALQVAEQISEAAQSETKGDGDMGTTMRRMISAGVSDETLLTGMSMAAGYLSK